MALGMKRYHAFKSDICERHYLSQSVDIDLTILLKPDLSLAICVCNDAVLAANPSASSSAAHNAVCLRLHGALPLPVLC